MPKYGKLHTTTLKERNDEHRCKMVLTIMTIGNTVIMVVMVVISLVTGLY